MRVCVCAQAGRKNGHLGVEVSSIWSTRAHQRFLKVPPTTLSSAADCSREPLQQPLVNDTRWAGSCRRSPLTLSFEGDCRETLRRAAFSFYDMSPSVLMRDSKACAEAALRSARTVCFTSQPHTTGSAHQTP